MDAEPEEPVGPGKNARPPRSRSLAPTAVPVCLATHPRFAAAAVTGGVFGLPGEPGVSGVLGLLGVFTGGCAVALLRSARFWVTLLRSAPVQGVSRPPHAASRDCRTAHPLPVRSRVRLHRNAGSREKRKQRAQANQKANKRLAKRCSRGASEAATRISVSDHTRSAASRAGMAGWAGEGGGRFGERREYEAPTLPSTPRQHGSARHQIRQARNATKKHHQKVSNLRTPSHRPPAPPGLWLTRWPPTR